MGNNCLYFVVWLLNWTGLNCFFVKMKKLVGWLVGWSDGNLIGWLVVCLVGFLVG